LTLLIYNKLICLKNINNIMIYMIVKVNLKHIYIYIYIYILKAKEDIEVGEAVEELDLCNL
jgi:hypothetical protein